MDSHTSQIPPQSAADALSRMHSALDYFTSADLHALGTVIQGQALRDLTRISARISAIQGAVLAVFDAAGGPEEAGCGTAATWHPQHAGDQGRGEVAAAVVPGPAGAPGGS